MIIEEIQKDPSLLQRINVKTLLEICGGIFLHCEPNIVGQLFYEVYIRGNEDDIIALRQNIYMHLHFEWQRILKTNGTREALEILGGAHIEEVARIFNSYAKKIANYWRSGK